MIILFFQQFVKKFMYKVKVLELHVVFKSYKINNDVKVVSLNNSLANVPE